MFFQIFATISFIILFSLAIYFTFKFFDALIQK